MRNVYALRETQAEASREDYPVKQFSGTKSIVISTVSWIGGKQPFLGWAYIAAAILCVFLAAIGLVRHLVKPRKLGDMSCAHHRNLSIPADRALLVLSWNQPSQVNSR